MNLYFTKHSLTSEDIIAAIQQKNTAYNLLQIGNRLIIVKFNFLVAAVVSIKKKHISINGNFPYFYVSLIFAIVVIAIGIIIPLVLYFIFLYPKMKRAEREICEILRQNIQ